MAAKLQVRLTFQGGEELKKALADIGVDGQKKLNGLATAADTASSAFKGLASAVGLVAKTVAAAGGLIGAAGAAIFAVAKSSAEAADQAGKAAQKIGVNAQAYQELAFAAKLADVEQDSLQAGLKILNKNIAEAANGNKELAAAFAAVGIKLQQSRALTLLEKFQLKAGELKSVPKTLISADQALLKLADVFAKAPDGPQKTAAAMQFLGKSGADLIPLLNTGSKSIAGLGTEFRRLGGVFSDEAIAKSEEFNDTLTILEAAIVGVKNAVGQVFIPELTSLAKLLTEFVVRNRDAIVEWVQKGWLFLKQVVLDIVAVFQGRDADVVNKWVLTVRDGLEKTLTVASAVGNALFKIFQVLGLIEKSKEEMQANLDTARAALPVRADGVLARFATGGHVHGPGTGTSDSILARLSKGEFVIRSAIVERMGAPFFAALNAGMVPAFADGGSVGGRPVNLNFDGGSFPLSAGEGVVAQLTRAARKRALTMPGRAPSWKTRR